MMTKVYLTGADPYNWALREDQNETEKAIASFAILSPLKNADIIHSVYWETLEELPTEILNTKPVICNLSGEWERYESDFGPRFTQVAGHVNCWIVRSKQAQATVEAKGLKAFYIPYTVNIEVFQPLAIDKAALRRKYKIPEDAFLIGNFMRDSSAGGGFPAKMVKGPDIFADIAFKLCEEGLPIHVLLAGPRRHWLRKELKKRGIPYSFIGLPLPIDDMRINALSRPRLNVLYNLLDLALVTSRSEAGPHAILEAAASRCPQISTAVGIATDVLPPSAIYKTPEEACALIKKEMKERFLRHNTDSLLNKVRENYTAPVIAPLLETFYAYILKP